MTQRKMSIAEALIELNLLEKRINRATNTTFVTVQKGKDLPAGYKTVEEVETHVKGNYQSVKDLIELRNKVKANIVVSNANTIITVGEAKMTVAEAIERKSSIGYEKALLASLKGDYHKAASELARYNEGIRTKADNVAESFIGRETSNKSVVEEANGLRDSYNKNHEGKLIDPIGVLAQIEELEVSIEDFEANVDLALNISNATTSFLV